MKDFIFGEIYSLLQGNIVCFIYFVEVHKICPSLMM